MQNTPEPQGKASGMEGQIQRLNTAVGELADTVGEMCQRLEPVLREDEPQYKKDEKVATCDDSGCPLVVELWRITERVAALRMVVVTRLDRLEI